MKQTYILRRTNFQAGQGFRMRSIFYKFNQFGVQILDQFLKDSENFEHLK